MLLIHRYCFDRFRTTKEQVSGLRFTVAGNSALGLKFGLFALALTARRRLLGAC